ncbi:MAG: DNA-formamidopyrimidine glycosylase [Candidatus Magasanikbacteria bacterium CG_4_10_14_0_2_um_filter_37_12]|uniref:DNA-formamidopyrimidine glycosylase n=1 Tax=Candidatus Magasanikbacteria bacterium CG_4_10_14_0_2_um_filter_37_12 TaxID=1974637 RepID=A0A2M7V6P2_9BACT|nr:MAG: DNA-formamidopyrimidine glycosylase [Candidatus Magasanikbacteria bacterium CG_4_10_14_0_2_um_filter_37_12]
MPELPEIETIVRDLKTHIVGLSIDHIELRLPKMVKQPEGNFLTLLENNHFSKIRRRAKYLIFEINNSTNSMVVHLRMTGQMIYKRENNFLAGGHGTKEDLKTLPNKFSHIIFYFVDGSQLFFNDMRQFGYLEIADENRMQEIDVKLGVEPLEQEFTLEKFEKLLEKKKVNIKSFLLNQKFVVGLGNIYVDETLFDAEVLPNRPVNSLAKSEIKKIYKAIIRVLRQAVKERGTTFNDYRDANGNKGNFFNFLKVYGRSGKKCKRCKSNVLKKNKIAGRGTVYCRVCQK